MVPANSDSTVCYPAWYGTVTFAHKNRKETNKKNGHN